MMQSFLTTVRALAINGMIGHREHVSFLAVLEGFHERLGSQFAV